MTFGKNPRRQVHLDVERIDFARLQIVRIAHRFALRAVDSRAGDLRNGAVGRDIGQPREPIGQRRRRRSSQQRVRTPENRDIVPAAAQNRKPD